MRRLQPSARLFLRAALALGLRRALALRPLPALALFLTLALVAPPGGSAEPPSLNASPSTFDPGPGIEFRTASIVSEGVRLHAEVFADKAHAGRRLPTIIQANGWGGVAAAFRRDAIDFARAGYRVINFDYRGWGLSDGRLVLAAPPEKSDGRRHRAEVEELRGYIDPIEQVADWANVVHWAMGEPTVDGERVGLRGTSYSGGHVVYTAARDPRIRAIVSQVAGFNSGWVLASEPMRQATFGEATRRARAELGYPDPDARVVGNLRGAPIRAKLALYSPLEEAHKLRDTAVLFVVAEREELFDNALNAGRAHELVPSARKRYVTLPNISHYGIYREGREQAVRLAIEWFDEHLKQAR